jgi:hypothetical protein
MECQTLEEVVTQLRENLGTATALVANAEAAAESAQTEGVHQAVAPYKEHIALMDVQLAEAQAKIEEERTQ